MCVCVGGGDSPWTTDKVFNFQKKTRYVRAILLKELRYLSDIEGQIQGHPDFEAFYLVKDFR